MRRRWSTLSSRRDRNSRQPLNVLLVEDDSDTRAGMRKVLVEAGFTVTEADDGLRALEIASQRRFDAIVCDLRLPYLPGGGFYEALLERDPELAKRVIFVSAIAHDPAVRQFLERPGGRICRSRMK